MLCILAFFKYFLYKTALEIRLGVEKTAEFSMVISGSDPRGCIHFRGQNNSLKGLAIFLEHNFVIVS